MGPNTGQPSFPEVVQWLVRSRTLESDCPGSNPGSLLPSSVTLGKSLKHSVTQFPHLSNGHCSSWDVLTYANSLAQSWASTPQIVYQNGNIPVEPDLHRLRSGLPGGPWVVLDTSLERGTLADSSHHSLLCAENLVLRAQHTHDSLITLMGWIEGIFQMRKLRLRKVLCLRQPQQVSRRPMAQPPIPASSIHCS